MRPPGAAGTLEGMTDATSHETDRPGTALLEAAGITSTPEGRAEARRKLAAGRARLTPELLAEVRTQAGLPTA